MAAYSSQSSERSESTRSLSLSPVCLHNNWGIQLAQHWGALPRPSLVQAIHSGVRWTSAQQFMLPMAPGSANYIPGTRREPRRPPHHQGSPIEAWDTPGAEKARLTNSEEASNLSGTLP